MTLESRLEWLHEASFGWAVSCRGWHEADPEDVLQSTYVKVISGRRAGHRPAPEAAEDIECEGAALHGRARCGEAGHRADRVDV